MLLTPLLLFFGAANGWAQGNNLIQRLEHAAALVAEERLDQAEQEVTIALKAAPQNPSALNLLGAIRAKQGRLNEAETLFLRAIKADDRFVGAHVNLAYLYTLQGLPQKTIAEWQQVLRLDPKNSEALAKVAPLLLTAGDTEEGIRLLERAKEVHSISVAQLVTLGDAYVNKGTYSKAEENYQLALSQQSDDTDAVLGLAQVSQLKHDGNTAALYLARARKMSVNSPETLYRFALVALRAGMYEEANVALQAAIKLKPDDPAYFLALGTTWLKKPDLFEAEQAFRRAVELQAENPLAQMYLGYALLEQKKYAEAREWLEKSLLKDTKTPETFYYLGLIAAERNENQRALEFFSKAVQLAPTYHFAHIGLGSIYLKLRDYPRAQRELELAIQLSPDDPQAHYNLAVLYSRLKNTERAQQEMKIVDDLKNAARLKKAVASPPSAIPASRP